MLARLSSIDKVSIVALAKNIENAEGTMTVNALATKLGVPLMSENRNRKDLILRISAKEPADPTKEKEPKLSFAVLLISLLLCRSGAVSRNRRRASYAPWFKDFIASKKDEGVSYEVISELTGISVNTLTDFKPSLVTEKKTIAPKSKEIARIWNEAPPHRRRNLDAFWYYLGKKYPNVSVSFKEVRQILIDLGLRYPRGPKTENHGTQVKKSFEPHAMWEGDGKQIKIRINGALHNYLWYCFTDQNTTLLVGSSIERTESASSFLSTLKNGGANVGTYPIGILIDNRLSDEDMSPINRFCKEHGIVLVRTFPGNSKSNGDIENNFSIFERYVGEIDIRGTTCLLYTSPSPRDH